MENKRLSFFAGLAIVLALLSSPAAAGAEGYRNLSAQIIKCAETNAFKKITVLEFSAKGGAGYALFPMMKVIFMSGYTDNTLTRQNLMKPGTMLLEKPLKEDSILRKVREVLNGEPQ
ncbi:MAG: hypothetical protein Q7R35_01520 [Elusimicrobiota bacterium]|nr:hypothetical protein [Elusimicrobiota bacterium]